ncbi:hypothetical protein FHS56_000249 [Thermonema lapsum]|uniref:Uncharacterized protein n=1 Tax=Thermonema lapsum TaxID=28195 RepID=A0A846MMI7_9BACT|nr:hypothetical protein [Thermonema lapsum]NIK72763.1 hypothetical protein [Thermonema lapsum]
MELNSYSKRSIPPKEREEWKKMITGEIEHNYRNFVLKLMLTQLRREVAFGMTTMPEAIDRLYQLCEKYSLAVQPDCKEIFKSW